MEQLVARGPAYRLALVAAMVLGVSIVGGLVAIIFGAPESVAGAVWWAFLRLTDPGYLGDDEGAARRTISTIVTVTGYVLFMGALIAIMTQWFNARMEQLEAGLTPIAAKGHILILGWTPQTARVVGELTDSRDRMGRFLAHRGLPLPPLVAEIHDIRKLATARRAYPGYGELIPSDHVICRLIGQVARTPAISHVYNELLTHARGSALYIRDEPTLVGRTFADLAECFPTSVPLGLVRGDQGNYEVRMAPPQAHRVVAGDRVVLVAQAMPAARPWPNCPAQSRRWLPTHVHTALAKIDASVFWAGVAACRPSSRSLRPTRGGTSRSTSFRWLPKRSVRRC
ncbi:MAG: hypothetical protein ACI9OJ_001420 [Myxococcota bacterium]|jgi:hypothetical protein